jgi:hypothetical protein
MTRGLREHASRSPGPVNCNIRLRLQVWPYPECKCERCNNGPCPFFHTDGAPKSETVRRTEAERRQW